MEKVKTEANAVVQRFLQLDEDTQEELKNAFPMVASIVYSKHEYIFFMFLTNYTA
jgi:hypothetical protein